MKSLRIWLLLLLAFVLPLRGALATALPCGGGVAHGHAAARMPHGGQALHIHEAGPAGHAAPETASAASDDDGAAPHGAPAGHHASGKCSFCAACCAVCAPALVGFQLPEAAPVAARFAETPAPAAEFLATGPERPPRAA